MSEQLVVKSCILDMVWDHLLQQRFKENVSKVVVYIKTEAMNLKV